MTRFKQDNQAQKDLSQTVAAHKEDGIEIFRFHVGQLHAALNHFTRLYSDRTEAAWQGH